MGFLSVLHLAVIPTRSVGHVIVAVELGSLGTSRGHGCLGQCRGVGTHVGDVAALVETLGDPHGALGIPAEAPRGLLLQGGCHERGLGAALARLLDNRADGVVDTLESGGERSGCRLIDHHAVAAGEAALLVKVASCREALALDEIEAGGEGTGIECGGQVPVRRGDKGDALAFAIDHEAHRDGLHSTG